ncbi:MAG: GntR family transcriptional regulator [Chloroflexota bacterium]
MNLDRPASLAVQIARLLRKQLQRDDFNEERLPSEPELASQFQVSRGTVRQALVILEREGIVFRRHGSGTYVNEYVLRIEARAETAFEFSELLRRSGFDPTIKVLEAREIVHDDLAEKLEIPLGTPCLTIRKLFLANGEPAIYNTDIIPRTLNYGEYTDDELHTSIFEFMEEKCGQEIVQMLSEIIPTVVDDELATLLHMEPGAPLLQFDEVHQNKLYKPVFFSRNYYRRQFVRFSVLRSKA